MVLGLQSDSEVTALIISETFHGVNTKPTTKPTHSNVKTQTIHKQTGSILKYFISMIFHVIY